MDRWIVEQSGLSDMLPRSIDTPVTLCSSLRDFIEPQFSYSQLSEANRDARIRKLDRGMQDEQYEDFVRGIYLPGQGTFINGYMLALMYELDSANDLLSHDQGIIDIITTIAHEKYGHGYLSECTPAGRERRERNLYRLRLARQFTHNDTDSPEGDFEMGKTNIVFDTCNITEEGWAVWIEYYVFYRLKDTLLKRLEFSPYETGEVGTSELTRQQLCSLSMMRKIAGTMAHYGNNQRLRENSTCLANCLDRLNNMLYPSSLDIEGIASLEISLDLQGLAEDDDFTDEFSGELDVLSGKPEEGFEYVGFVYHVGHLIMRLIEAKFGPRCVAEAVTLACNVTLDIANSGPLTLNEQTRTVPKANIDARLIQLLSLPAEAMDRDDPGHFRHLAWDCLNIPAPENQ